MTSTAGCFRNSFTTVTVWRVLRKRLHLKAYKLSIVQHLMDADTVVRKEFCMQMFHRVQDDERFLDTVIFSDESKFHVSAGSTCLPGKMFVTAQT
jgi:predicted GTPase